MTCKRCRVPLMAHEGDLCVGCAELAKRHEAGDCPVCAHDRPGEVYDVELGAWAIATCVVTP